MWKWQEIEAAKVERAKKVKLLATDPDTQQAECVGSSGEIYKTTLNSCTCIDYARNHNACKHMVRLAMEVGILNEKGKTVEQQQAFDLMEAKNALALWYGYYYLFQKRIVSDVEYDALKQKLSNEYGVKFSLYSNDDFSVKTDLLSTVRVYLDKMNLEYIDKTPQGGSLYFFDQNVVDVIRAMGLKVSYAAQGTRSTKHRPAWFVNKTEK